MPLNLEDKKVLVAEVTEVAKTALSVVAAEYRGLTVTQMTDLRAKARASGRVHACRQEHAGTQGVRRHGFRTGRPEIEGSAGTGFLEG